MYQLKGKASKRHFCGILKLQTQKAQISEKFSSSSLFTKEEDVERLCWCLYIIYKLLPYEST